MGGTILKAGGREFHPKRGECWVTEIAAILADIMTTLKTGKFYVVQDKNDIVDDDDFDNNNANNNDTYDNNLSG